eukprot:1200601-Rhodomonas_salina.2
MLLPAYAMPGTDLAHAAVFVSKCYAMSGTDIACPVCLAPDARQPKLLRTPPGRAGTANVP